MYKVLVKFADGENGVRWPLDKGGYVYAVGDLYPMGDFEPGREHIAYLTGSNNKLRKPIIALVEDGPSDDGGGPDGKHLSDMSKSDLVTFAFDNNIPLDDAKNKADILAVIEEALRE